MKCKPCKAAHEKEAFPIITFAVIDVEKLPKEIGAFGVPLNVGAFVIVVTTKVGKKM